jgi:hypothetical protein
MMDSSASDLCKRCGKCCHFEYKGIRKTCPQLYEKEGKTWCKIYRHRLGAIMGTIHNTPFYCGMRKDSTYDYLGCPYNTNKKMLY